MIGVRLRQGKIVPTNASEGDGVSLPTTIAFSNNTRKRNVCRTLAWCSLACTLAVGIVLYALVAILEHNIMNQSQGLLLHNATARRDRNQTMTRLGSYQLLETIPHDTRAFTQGLLVTRCTSSPTRMNATLPPVGARLVSPLCMYEGTGVYGSSQLRQLNMRSCQTVVQHRLSNEFFGEGIAHYRDSSEATNGPLRIVQLTWLEQTAFEYEVVDSPREQEATVQLVANWTYETTTGEGWGITYNSNRNVFYVSDGSSYIHTWDAPTKQPIRKVAVRYQFPDMPNPMRIHSLNELEWDPVTNTILANVWKEDVILRIDPQSGFVETIYDLRTLYPKSQRSWRGHDVLNGIALTYDWMQYQQEQSIAQRDPKREDAALQVWVTGKNWPHMYRIQLLTV